LKDSEKLFVDKWEEDRIKGKYKYVIINSLKSCAVFYGVFLIGWLVKGYDIHQVVYKIYENWVIILAGFLGGAFGYHELWKSNEAKYYRFLNIK
jgi:hypothetical protein